MPQAKPIILNDGTADVTFGPQSGRNGSFIFLDKASGQPDLFSTMSLSLSRNPAGVYKPEVDLAIRLPVTDTSTGVIAVKSVANAHVKFSFPPNATGAERARVIELAKAALANADIISVCKDLESVY